MKVNPFLSTVPPLHKVSEKVNGTESNGVQMFNWFADDRGGGRGSHERVGAPGSVSQSWDEVAGSDHGPAACADAAGETLQLGTHQVLFPQR